MCNRSVYFDMIIKACIFASGHDEEVWIGFSSCHKQLENWAIEEIPTFNHCFQCLNEWIIVISNRTGKKKNGVSHTVILSSYLLAFTKLHFRLGDLKQSAEVLMNCGGWDRRLKWLKWPQKWAECQEETMQKAAPWNFIDYPEFIYWILGLYI